jgi:hypothetical protein
VYADGDNRSYDRAATYTMGGMGIVTTSVRLIDAANTNFSAAFTLASNSKGNYVKFSINDGAFTLTATPEAGSGTRRAPVNAIEIVPTTPASSSNSIGVNFVGANTVSMDPGETAGVVARTNWNSALGASRSTPQALVDETGMLTSATITWAANNVWMTPISDQPGNRRMMKGYLDTSSTSPTTVTVASLELREYDVFVYADGDNRTYARTGAYTISGPGITATTIRLTDQANTNFSGIFAPAANSNGNYVKFSIAASRFTLTATPLTGENPTLRAPINGIQIVPRVSGTAAHP